MSINIALVGNPNCGKTTLFNALTGANQYVGNWPGVTVEKKEGRIKWDKETTVTDLPGIYSLSPYSPEEIIARNFLVNESPDAIINILDGTNLERSLYLTTQLAELKIPMVVAINMMDVVRKNNEEIDVSTLSKELGCAVVEIAAVKGEGVKEILEAAVSAHANGKLANTVKYSHEVESALKSICDLELKSIDESKRRFYAVKLFERDELALGEVQVSEAVSSKIDGYIKHIENSTGDDSESIIINARYDFITTKVVKKSKKKGKDKLSLSDKIDKVVTNRFAALPIFAVIMFLVYFIAMAPGLLGDTLTGWANDGLFGDGFHFIGIGEADYNAAVEEFNYYTEIVEGAPEGFASGSFELDRYDVEGTLYETVTITYADYEKALTAVDAGEPDPASFGAWVPGIPVVIGWGLEAAHSPEWLTSLILDGIVGGVGAVLGFVPQLLILFLLLSLLEDCGYMSRVAFILDRLFRRFGLSGKSFIPMLVAVGCGVPGIMASRTIEQERDRRMTIMTTGFIPCSAKMPIVGLVAGALFGGNALIATASYFIGIGAVVVSGIILKKTRAFLGEPAPFVMELPAYHLPVAGNVFRSTWERGWSFIKRAGTVIFAASVIIWVLNSLSFEGGFHYITEESGGASILENIGTAISYLFIPVGFGSWQAAVATFLGLVAKEEVVGFFGTVINMDPDLAMELAEMSSATLHATIGEVIFSGSQLSAFCFLIFNLLCAPCFGAMGAIKREMNNWKWTLFAIGYMTGFAYVIAMIIYQIGMLIRWGAAAFNFWTVVAFLALGGLIYLLVRPAGFSLIDLFKKKVLKKN
ncbi:MAG: ferrous iron transporter B [Clostridia bacterium]|nr:ferrous iron transporter B [Clostridia bacterium]